MFHTLRNMTDIAIRLRNVIPREMSAQSGSLLTRKVIPETRHVRADQAAAMFFGGAATCILFGMSVNSLRHYRWREGGVRLLSSILAGIFTVTVYHTTSES